MSTFDHTKVCALFVHDAERMQWLQLTDWMPYTEDNRLMLRETAEDEKRKRTVDRIYISVQSTKPRVKETVCVDALPRPSGRIHRIRK